MLASIAWHAVALPPVHASATHVHVWSLPSLCTRLPPGTHAHATVLLPTCSSISTGCSDSCERLSAETAYA